MLLCLATSVKHNTVILKMMLICLMFSVLNISSEDKSDPLKIEHE